MGEQVLVVPATRLEPYLKFFEGALCRDPSVVGDAVGDLLGPGTAFYRDRAGAEGDPSSKQVIPYCALAANTHVPPRYFTYQRGPAGGEARLHGKWSVGVGGHVNPGDGEASADAYQAAFWRELAEEVSLAWCPELHPEAEPRALLYDPSDAVGRVHLGVVHALRLTTHELLDLLVTEKAMTAGPLYSAGALRKFRDHYESWSRVLIDNLLE